MVKGTRPTPFLCGSPAAVCSGWTHDGRQIDTHALDHHDIWRAGAKHIDESFCSACDMDQESREYRGDTHDVAPRDMPRRVWLRPPFEPCLEESPSCSQFQNVKVLSIPLGLSREKILREKLFLGLVQIESKVHRLISICTKPRKSFSRQILSLDKPSGIDNTPARSPLLWTLPSTGTSERPQTVL